MTSPSVLDESAHGSAHGAAMLEKYLLKSYYPSRSSLHKIPRILVFTYTFYYITTTSPRVLITSTHGSSGLAREEIYD